MTSEESWITTVPWDQAEGTLKDAYDWQAASLGEPAAFTQLGSLYPDIVAERLRLYKVVEEAPSALTPLERRLAAFVASTLNETPHCSSGLVYRLNDLDAPAGLLEQIRTDPFGVNTGEPRLDALVRYAATLTRNPGEIDVTDINRLRAAGFADLDILDLNNIVAYYNYINRVANGLGLRSEIPPAVARNSVPG
jgi:uncharacterized peroxidase-related enzyme